MPKNETLYYEIPAFDRPVSVAETEALHQMCQGKGWQLLMALKAPEMEEAAAIGLEWATPEHEKIAASVKFAILMEFCRLAEGLDVVLAEGNPLPLEEPLQAEEEGIGPSISSFLKRMKNRIR